MADGIKAVVEARVVRTHKAGSTLAIRRQSKDGDERWKDYLTAWGLFGVHEGDLVRVEGDLSASLRYYEGRPQVSVNLNDLTAQEVLEHAAVPGDVDPATGELAGSGAGWGA